MKKLLISAWVVCASSLAMAQTYDVTFIVDMNEVTETFTTPEVNGTFNGWCGGCAPMSDDNGDNIWELTIALSAGFYEYKFAYDSWAGQENLTPGDSCTLTTDIFTNRVINVAASESLDTVCWASCNACAEVIPSYEVVFRVDMSQVTESYSTPEVNGTFNGWCGGCAPLSDTDGDNIWELAVTLPEGVYEYKFAYDSWAGQEELTSGDPCTITTEGFTNRLLDVTADVTLADVCWGSCDTCLVVPDQLIETAFSSIHIYPNPTRGIAVLQNLPVAALVTILNSQGNPVFSHMANRVNETLDLSTLPAGLYYIQVLAGQNNISLPVLLIP